MNDDRISRREFLRLIGLVTGVTAIGGIGSLLGLFKNNDNGRSKSPLIIPTGPQTAYAQTTGSWALTGKTSAPAIHASLLYTGKILYVAGSGYGPLYPAGTYKANIIDPNTSTETSVPLSADLFCSGQTQLANGNLLFAGGTLLYDTDPNSCNGRWHGLNVAFEFHVDSSSFVSIPSMAHGRWYPTHITLTNGKVIIVNGLDEYGVGNQLDEVYDPSSQTFSIQFAPNRSTTYCVGAGQTACTGAGSPCYGSTNNGVAPTLSFYPRMHLMPSGLLFAVGESPGVWSLDPTTGKWNSVLTTSQYRSYGSSFLLPLQNTASERGKILIVGGSSTPSMAAIATAQLLDFNQGTNTKPVLRNVQSLTYARRVAAPVILPNGQCVMFGGSSIGESSPVLIPESFDPVSETWQILPTASVARVYHQVSLLLPDGRVWTANSQPRPRVFEPRIEIFSPGYLFAGTRPTISAAPTIVGGYGGTISIPTPDAPNVTSVSLVRLMTMTHHFEPNQRFIWLQIVNTTSSSITVSAPINANIAPPGYYMIHILNSSSIPSVAAIINIPGSGTGSSGPSQVTGLTVASSTTAYQLNLAWTANPSTDNVTKYNVYRSTTPGFTVNTATDTPLASPTTNSYSDTALTASTTYYYSVAAVNNSGTIGTPSNIASGTTTSDTTSPTLKITSPANNASIPHGTVPVNGTASDDVGGSGINIVEVKVDSGAFAAATPAAPGNWSTWSTTVSITSTGSHTITAKAIDNAGNTRTRNVTITTT